MNYEQIVFDILLEAGDRGLPIKKIARHVHNSVNTFFEQKSYEDVNSDIRKFVKKNSRNSYSFLEHTSERGYYRLNKNSEKYIQLRLFA